jgi:hypothetical protein
MGHLQAAARSVDTIEFPDEVKGDLDAIGPVL